MAVRYLIWFLMFLTRKKRNEIAWGGKSSRHATTHVTRCRHMASWNRDGWRHCCWDGAVLLSERTTTLTITKDLREKVRNPTTPGSRREETDWIKEPRTADARSTCFFLYFIFLSKRIVTQTTERPPPRSPPPPLTDGQTEKRRRKSPDW